MCINRSKRYVATIVTDVGTIEVELATKQAPQTVNSFVFLARNRYFDGVAFHRVISEYIDQTGDPAGDGRGGQTAARVAEGLPPPYPGYQLPDEIPPGYEYRAGDVAMANAGANTNGSQFFFVVTDAGAKTVLDAVGGVPKYTPFGRVLRGMSVVRAINADGSTSGSPTVLHKVETVHVREL